MTVAMYARREKLASRAMTRSRDVILALVEVHDRTETPSPIQERDLSSHSRCDMASSAIPMRSYTDRYRSRVARSALRLDQWRKPELILSWISLPCSTHELVRKATL
jgi:hypothetical protein